MGTSAHDVATCVKSSEKLQDEKARFALHRLQTTLDGGDCDLLNKVCDMINCIATYFERDVRV